MIAVVFVVPPAMPMAVGVVIPFVPEPMLVHDDNPIIVMMMDARASGHSAHHQGWHPPICHKRNPSLLFN